MYREFVNSHFLSSLQLFHFMDISDAIFSKCFLSLNQFFVKSDLLSSRLFIPTIYASQFPNDWNELVFEIHEWKCQEYKALNSCFKISDFACATG